MIFDIKRLKAERVAKGLSQEQMASEMGMSRIAYAKRELGLVDIGVNEFIKMASILGYSKDDTGIFFTTTVPDSEL